MKNQGEEEKTQTLGLLCLEQGNCGKVKKNAKRNPKEQGGASPGA